MAKLLINGRLAAIDQADFAQFHGNSVFTTLRSHNGELKLWPQHWRRLCDHAHFFSFKVPAREVVYRSLSEILASEPEDQKIRIIINNDSFAITCEPFVSPSPEIYRGVTIIYSSIMVHPLLKDYKTANSLPYMLAKKEADSHQAFEALLSDQWGHIVDGSRTSIMLLNDNVLTSLEGGLKGCMREQVLTYAKSIGLKIKRAHLKREELSGQLLLANSLLGVVPVGRPESHKALDLVTYFQTDRDRS